MSTSLLTLPRTALRGAGFVPDGCHVALLAPVHRERVRAARALRKAVASGRIDSATVTRAVAAGDAGVAALFQAHAATPPRPRIKPDTIDLRGLDTAPTPDVCAGLARLIETLSTDGDLTREALATVPGLRPRELAVCLNAAWTRRVERVTRGLRALLPHGTEICATHVVYPAALYSLFQQRNGCIDDQASDLSQQDAIIGLNSEACLWVGSEADGREDSRALRAAWNAVVRSLTTGTLEPWHTAADTGYLAFALETLIDLALKCEWEGDEPLVEPDQLAVAAEEMGEDAYDEALHERMRAFMRQARAEKVDGPWTPRSKGFRAWQASQSGTPTGVTVERLLAVARWARKHACPDRLNVSNDDDEGLFSITPVHRATGFGDRAFDFMCEEQSQVGCALLSFGREPGSQLSLGQVLDALIADAAVAGAAWSIFLGDQSPT
ncbi:hypothetical protein [Aquimonas sp.]|jgi:hypothetical protein|uniref:hypothetical protein n=1 Tax=Aquimonas sp. TaxID=1872588 RepID=UPI0037BE87A9